MKPKISIIVTAYNRPNYLLQALRSLEAQKVEKYDMEIIVVKNFKDQNIDESIKRIGAITVEASSSPLCDYAYKGICSSTGRYIFFLEDDDIFVTDKINHVVRIMDGQGIDYYHNVYIPADDQLEVVDSILYKQLNRPFMLDTSKLSYRDLYRILKIKGDINLSSMCINRRIVDEKFSILSKLSAGPDWFLLFASITNGKKLYFDSAPLTIYRIHESTVNSNVKNIEEFLAKRRLLITKEISSLNSMRQAFDSRLIHRLIDTRIATNLIQLSIVGNKDTDRIRNSDFSFKMTFNIRMDLFGFSLLFIYSIKHLFPRVSKSIYFKVLQNVTFGRSSNRNMN